MAYVDSTLSCPMATAGFGKRLTNGQRIARRGDFSHLPEREAYLAAFIDQLPEGAQMDIKTLAQAQPRFGQAAVASALRNLTLAGHLRRVQICVGEGGNRWAYRTWFSAVPHDDEWWTEFLRTEDAATPPAFPEETPCPPPRATTAPWRTRASWATKASKGMMPPLWCRSCGRCVCCAGRPRPA
ncbi:hypothetical protein ACFQZC_16835 [Streptacidiphilus monticola]